jgi:thioesterase domain-containing protein/acyl carrier protein
MRNVEDIYPLSPMQHLMLVHSLSHAQPESLCEQFVCRLDADLDADAFAAAWGRVVERHTILRTAFLWQRLEKPLQVVRQRVSVPLARHDWGGLAPDERRESVARYLAEDRRRNFDLQKAPLIRLALLRMDEGAYQFVWSFHHLLLDGWCLSLVLKEVLAFYEALREGREPSLERPRPFKDYVAWLQRQDLSAAEAFWRRALKGFVAPTPLPLPAAERRGPAEGAERAAVRQLRLDEETTEALRSVARRQRLTLNTLVQGAWALLLSGDSGCDDVLFGATVSGRPPGLPGVETMIGLFINLLPVRVSVSAGAPLLPWLEEIQGRQLEAQPYQFSPLAQVQGWSEVPPHLPLFESLLVFENYPVERGLEARESGARATDIGGSAMRTNYPLTVAAHPGRQLVLEMYYDGARFADEAVAAALERLGALLKEIVSDPERRLGEFRRAAARGGGDGGRCRAEGEADALRRVEGVLSRHPRIRDVKVMMREDAPDERRVAAYFVADGRHALTTSELCAYLREELPGRLLPSDFVPMDALPRGEDGGVEKRALPVPETFYCWNRSRESSFYTSLSDTFEIEVAQICEETLGIRPVGPGDNFFDLGGSSVLAVRLMTRIQQHFKQDLPLSTLLRNGTARDLARVLRGQAAASPPSPLVPIQPRGTRPPLYCMHPVGGNVLCYVDLARHLDPEQPVYGVEAAGLRDGEEPRATVEEMAAHYVEAICAAQAEGPYMLAGLSFGGYLAYEVAQQLCRRGADIGLLALFDSWALRCGGRFAYDFDGPKVLAGQANVIARQFRGKELGLDPASFIGLPAEEQVEYVLGRMEQADAVPPDIGRPQLRRVLRMHQLNATALRGYVPLPYPGRVTLFRAEVNTGLDYIARHPALGDPELGWGELITEPMEIHDVPGDHGLMVYEPFVKALAERLGDCLVRAQA